MATVQLPAEQRILLHNVSWQTYEALLNDLEGPGAGGVRLTYDQGSLEIMTTSHGHENYAELIARFVEALTEELDVPIHSGGSTTFKRKAKKRGLEPDKCYWIQNEPLMRGKKEFDIDTDPPPDLAIEVAITSSSLNRMAIYAALGVPEVWRFDGEVLRIYQLGADGEYEPCDRSPTFPYLPPAEVVRFLRLSDTQDETSLVRAFRAWVREHILPAHEGAEPSPRSRHRRGKARRKKGKNGA
jgi:Uma2 family endonuclease